MEFAARRPPAAVDELITDRGIPVEGDMRMADVAAGAALGAERSTSPAVGLNEPAQPVLALAAVADAAPEPARPAPAPAGDADAIPEPAISPGCTQAQLRRFIKSRAYVPMHELRRRFELNGAEDEVSAIRVADGTVYVGLGARESDFIAELVRQGDIGVELCHDPQVAMVVGVYAMRPISR
jgi:hypothetical protein